MRARDPKTILKFECKDRTLYRVHARNFKLGIFLVAKDAFLGLRTKFGSTFIDREFHWDDGEPYGTVQPLEELEALPREISEDMSAKEADAAITAWLHEAAKKYA